MIASATALPSGQGEAAVDEKRFRRAGQQNRRTEKAVLAGREMFPREVRIGRHVFSSVEAGDAAGEGRLVVSN